MKLWERPLFQSKIGANNGTNPLPLPFEGLSHFNEIWSNVKQSPNPSVPPKKAKSKTKLRQQVKLDEKDPIV